MTIRSIAAALTLTLLALPALALTQRSFVSGGGNDANPCSLVAPCRGFAAAIAKTAAGGEVIVLDSAGYGPVTVTKAISLIAPTGVYAGITVASGNGIAINAPGAVVVLRGLSINGQGGGPGVNVQSAARVRIESCVIANMSSNGLVHTAAGAELIMLDTIVRDNTGTGIGIAADASIVLDHVRSEHNLFDGFYVVPVSSEATATISDSVFAYNGVNGISVDTASGADTFVQVERSVMANNGGNGFVANGASGATRSTLSHNAVNRNGLSGITITGFKIGGLFATYGIISSNQVLANHDEGIVADGDGAWVQVSANTMTHRGGSGGPCDLRVLNGASFRSLGDNNATCRDVSVTSFGGF